MTVMSSGFNNRFHLNRYTDELYKGQVGSVSVQANPFQSARIQIEFADAQNGTATLAGTCNEVVTFTGHKGRNSVNYYTELDTIVTSGLTGTMTVTSMIGQGSPIKNLEFQESFYGHMVPLTDAYKLENPGYDESWQAILYCDIDVDIRLKDMVVDEDDPDLTEHEVIKRLKVPLQGDNDHYKIILR
jgi:hypothetical protein